MAISVDGNSVYFIKKYVLDNYGQGFFSAMIADVEPEIKAVLASPILSTQRYDLAVKDRLLEKFLARVGSEQEFRKCSIQEVDHQLKGILRFIARIISRKIILKNTQLVWNRHFSDGKAIARYDERRNAIIVTISGLEASHAFWLHVTQYVTHLYEIAENSALVGSYELLDRYRVQVDVLL